jgi:hypothetical protein
MRVLGPVLALLAALLVGCSSEQGDYCGALKDEKAAFTRLAAAAESKDPGYLSDALALFERMRTVAPSELRDEWDTVVFAWSDVVDALDAAGIESEAFDPDKRPDGVSAAQFANVRAVAAKLASARVLDAVGGINDYAKEACDVDLSL